MPAPTNSAPGSRTTAVSVIVPTYKEALNIRPLVERVERVREANALEIELLIMDDNSPDNTVEVVGGLHKPWVKLVVRKSNRGLSPAVIDGLKMAHHDTMMCMDADMSHPPEKIPELLAALDHGADFALGSRYVSGASTDAQWGLFRWLNSQVATLIAWPLTSAKDPMSGFFAIRRRTLTRAPFLNPVGYKIALELIVKCGCERIVEVPIHFADRQLGESKLSLKEQMKYLQHVRRLCLYKYPNVSYFLQFAAVGAMGVVVNVIVVTLAARVLSLAENVAIAAGIGVSMVCNFLLNRRFSFSYALGESVGKQFVGFVAACSLGAAVQYVTSSGINRALPKDQPLGLQLAVVGGVLAGMVFNYVLNRFFVFKKPRIEDATTMSEPLKTPVEIVEEPADATRR